MKKMKNLYRGIAVVALTMVMLVSLLPTTTFANNVWRATFMVDGAEYTSASATEVPSGEEGGASSWQYDAPTQPAAGAGLPAGMLFSGWLDASGAPVTFPVAATGSATFSAELAIDPAYTPPSAPTQPAVTATFKLADGSVFEGLENVAPALNAAGDAYVFNAPANVPATTLFADGQQFASWVNAADNSDAVWPYDANAAEVSGITHVEFVATTSAYSPTLSYSQNDGGTVTAVGSAQVEAGAVLNTLLPDAAAFGVSEIDYWTDANGLKIEDTSAVVMPNADTTYIAVLNAQSLPQLGAAAPSPVNTSAGKLEPTREILTQLFPQIVLDVSETTSGGSGYGYIRGSFTLENSGYVEDVTFRVQATSNDPTNPNLHVNLADGMGGGNASYNVSNDATNGNFIDITVGKIESLSGVSGANDYATFGFNIDNYTTPIGTTATFEIVSVSATDSSGNVVTLTRGDWKAPVQYPSEANMDVGLLVTTDNSWRFVPMGGTETPVQNPLTTVTRTEGDGLGGTRIYTPAVDALPSVTLRVETAPQTTNYVDATALRFELMLEATGDVAIPQAIETLLAGANSSSPKVLYDGSSLVAGMEDFLDYFHMDFTGTLYEGWKIELWMDGGVLNFRFTRSDMNAGAAAAVRLITPVITVKQFEFENVIANDARSGGYTISYVSDATKSFFEVPGVSLDASGVPVSINSVSRAIAEGGNASVNIELTEIADPTKQVEELLTNVQKNYVPWEYLSTGYNATTPQYGTEAGDGHPMRNTISNYDVVSTQDPNLSTDAGRIWFVWNWQVGADGVVLPSAVTELEIRETNSGATTPSNDIDNPNDKAGWNPSEITPLAFKLPVVDANTEWELVLTFDDKSTETITKADAATAAYPTDADGRQIVMLAAGKNLTNFSLKYTKSAGSTDAITITNEMQVMFELLDTHTATGPIYNNSFISVAYEQSGGGTNTQNVERAGLVNVVGQGSGVLIYGDVRLETQFRRYTGVDGWTGSQYTGNYSTFFWNEPLSIEVAGGLFGSMDDLHNPTYIVELPDNVALDPVALTGYPNAGDTVYSSTSWNAANGSVENGVVYNVQQYTADTSGGVRDMTMSAFSGNVKIELYNEFGTPDGKIVSDLSLARYVAVTFEGETLDASTNEGFIFNIPVRVTESVKSEHYYPTYAALTGYANAGDTTRTHIALNRQYQAGGDWNSTTSTDNQLTIGGTHDSYEFPNAVNGGKGHPDTQYDTVNGNPVNFVVDKTSLRTVGFSRELELTKSVTMPAGATTLYEGDTVDYTIDVRMSDVGGLIPSLAGNEASIFDIPDYTLYQMTDMLPAGQSVQDASIVVELSGVTVDSSKYSVLKRNVTNENGDTVQMIALEFSGGLVIEYGKHVTVSYKATQDSVDFLQASGKFTSIEYNTVSIFYNAADTGIESGKGDVKGTYASESSNAVLAEWWNGYTFNAGTSVQGTPLTRADMTRLEARVQVQVSDKRIAPGINKIAVGTNDYNMQNSGVDVTWSLTAYNGAEADLDMGSYYVVDVLPYGVSYTGVPAGYEAPTTIYTNTNQQQVLVWEMSALKKGESVELRINTHIDSVVFGSATNYSYIVPTEYFSPDSVALVAAGSTETHGTHLYGNDAVLLRSLPTTDANAAATVNAISGRAAVQEIETVNLLNSMRARAYKEVVNEAGTDSRTSATPLDTMLVSRGEVVTFNYYLSNEGTNQNMPYYDVEFYDVLPWVNDSYLTNDRDRNSGWNLFMEFPSDLGNVVTVQRQKIDGTLIDTLEYGVDYNVMLSDSEPGIGYDALKNHPAWVDLANWDVQNRTPRAFGVDLSDSYTLGAGERLVITWKMEVPNLPAVYVTSQAYNSASFGFKQRQGTTARTSDAWFSGEPEKVGIHVTDAVPEGLSLTVQKTLTDSRVTGSAEFDFRLERFESGNWNAFELNRGQYSNIALSGALDDSEYRADTLNTQLHGMFSIELESGVGAVGGTISGLPEGRYRVLEIGADAEYVVSYTAEAVDIGYTLDGNLVTQGTIGVSNVYTEPNDPPEPPDPPDPPVPPVPPDPPTPPIDTPPDPPAPPIIPPADPPDPPTPPGVFEPTPTPELDPLLDPEAPLAPAPEGDGRHWSLLNLMCALFAGITSIIMILMMVARRLTKRSDEEAMAEAMERGESYTDEYEEQRRKGGFVWRAVSAVVAVAAIVAFLITEDIRNPMVWACEWSPLMVTFAISQVLVMLGLRHSMRNPDDAEDTETAEL